MRAFLLAGTVKYILMKKNKVFCKMLAYTQKSTALQKSVCFDGKKYY